LQVSRSRKYTPANDDVGFVLKYECGIFDPSHPYIDLGRPMLAFTSRVRPAPNLPVRNLVPLPLPQGVAKGGPNSRFTVLSYNMLADLYAKVCANVKQPGGLVAAGLLHLQSTQQWHASAVCITLTQQLLQLLGCPVRGLT
jgi:hypothetical protein